MKIRLGVGDTINEMLIGHLLPPLETTTKIKTVKKVKVVSPDKQKIEDAKQERQEKVEQIKVSHIEEVQEDIKSLKLQEAILMAEIIGQPRCKTRRKRR